MKKKVHDFDSRFNMELPAALNLIPHEDDAECSMFDHELQGAFNGEDDESVR